MNRIAPDPIGVYSSAPEDMPDWARDLRDDAVPWACLYRISGRKAKRQSTPPVVEYADGGSLMRVKFPLAAEIDRVGGKRAKISRFSSASRNRMLDFIAALPKAGLCLPLFVTLTYPDQFPTDGQVWKRHLAAWRRRLERKYGKCLVIWKLEPQKRGAPHFHLMLYLVADIDIVWLSTSWYEVVASGDVKHLLAGTQVQRAESSDGVLGYAAKYLGKEVPAGWDNPGRYWGAWNRELAPIVMCRKEINWLQAYKLRRVAYRFMDVAARNKAARRRERLAAGKEVGPAVRRRGSMYRIRGRGAKAYLKSETVQRIVSGVCDG